MKLDPKDVVIVCTLIGTIVTQVSTCRQKEIEMQMINSKLKVTDGVIDSLAESMADR